MIRVRDVFREARDLVGFVPEEEECGGKVGAGDEVLRDGDGWAEVHD